MVTNQPVGQRKLQEVINTSAQISKASLIQRMAQRAVGVSQPVIQRNKHRKRFLNVATLGLRKAYVKHKRANQAVPNIQVQPLVDPVEEFAAAYEKARYYHKTDAGNLQSINQNGLLNYEDRFEMLGHDVGGMSKLGKEFKGDEKKGVYLGPKPFMVDARMTQNTVRAFLSADRTKVHHWFDTDIPSQELMMDENFRGGAVITKDSIFGNHVTTGSMDDLLNADDQKLQSILQAIASHYEGSAPDQTTLKQLLRSAIRSRRLSNAAFDNVV